jgi:2-polyprenyl-6-methoxyphenol hydroxylase-like FAD-dependent oxidoreductase
MSANRSDPGAAKGGDQQIAVIGAGVAGLTLAILLRRAGRQVTVFEARGREQLAEGAFLTLAPNGVNALRPVGLAEKVAALGMPTIGFEILNRSGRRLALIDERQSMRAAGAESITIRRADLLGALAAEAEAQGVELRFNHAVETLRREPERLVLGFTNGASVNAAWVAGCDGVWSKTRRLVFPGAPDPQYTGLTGTGGFVDLPAVPATNGFMRMVFGEKAFFGYIKQGDGPVFWFDSFPLPEEEAVARPNPQALAAMTRILHATDPHPIAEIAAAIDSVPRGYPVFDMAHLPRWHEDRVVLLGDAAHAVSPHAGQGASLAIEDAVVLAACLDARPGIDQAFAAYQALRQARAEHVVRISRYTGSQKQVTSRIGLFIRDLVLPIFIPLGARQTRAITRYRADLTPLERWAA